MQGRICNITTQAPTRKGEINESLSFKTLKTTALAKKGRNIITTFWNASFHAISQSDCWSKGNVFASDNTICMECHYHNVCYLIWVHAHIRNSNIRCTVKVQSFDTDVIVTETWLFQQAFTFMIYSQAGRNNHVIFHSTLLSKFTFISERWQNFSQRLYI